MKILSFDTSAKVAACALTDDEKILAMFTVNNGNTHTENLLPMIDDMLKKNDVTVNDISLFACTSGPGSFTGVRIGAAVLKGLAFGRNTPCVEVSTLEALAYNLFPIEGIIVPVMDARRGQLYNAVFDCDGKNMSRLCDDRAISAEELISELSGKYGNRRIFFCGDGYETACAAAVGNISVCDTPITLIPQNAVSVALLGLAKLNRGETVSDTAFSPSYLRKSQAEREREEREKAKNIQTGK